jgi:hypothetical protein
MPMDIEANLRKYLADRQPKTRYTSFDYCFNFFQSHRESGDVSMLATGRQMQQSCLHLGFYLASWGMFRNSALMGRSMKHYEDVIGVIASSPLSIWEIDAHCYTDENCAAIWETAGLIQGALPESNSEILVTKIMLGVFGIVPAFDNRFKKGFGVSKFGPKALHRISAFYRERAEMVECYRVATLDFDTGNETHRRYTRAKVIDMIFFIEGGPRGADIEAQ